MNPNFTCLVSGPDLPRSPTTVLSRWGGFSRAENAPKRTWALAPEGRTIQTDPILANHAFRIAAVLLPLLALQPAYAQYSAHRDGDIVRLEDARHKTIVSIIPSVGDETFEMQVNGQNILYFPYSSIEAFKANPRLSGIPLLAPWAGRLDEQGFYANGKKYNFNMTLGNVKGATPIHGFLSQNPFWEIVEVKADSKAAWLTCRLDFYRHPDWMEQFPFAHTIEITQRLQDGVLEVRDQHRQS